MSKDDFVGTWKLVSFELRLSDGETTSPFGKDAGGVLIYDARGNFSVQVMRQERPSFASGDMQDGTDEELRSAMGGYVAYYGTYEIDEAARTMIHNVEGSLFPNFIGSPLTRLFELSGDRLTLRSPPMPFGGRDVRTVLTLQRA
ncbi:MAG: lipocalin-like domain-containing protein [Chloroflexi bacterium]|nr:lipocalin-like domain-containing protein [Chloroflexota bacterium]